MVSTLMNQMSIILINQTLEIQISERTTIQPPFSGMETAIHTLTLDFSSSSEGAINGVSADGTRMMKAFLSSGESLMLPTLRYATLLKLISTHRAPI